MQDEKDAVRKRLVTPKLLSPNSHNAYHGPEAVAPQKEAIPCNSETKKTQKAVSFLSLLCPSPLLFLASSRGSILVFPRSSLLRICIPAYLRMQGIEFMKLPKHRVHGSNHHPGPAATFSLACQYVLVCIKTTCTFRKGPDSAQVARAWVPNTRRPHADDLLAEMHRVDS